MAVASALFGFSAFFATLSGLDFVLPDQDIYATLIKNTIAAGLGQFVSSPFQLLKTSAAVSGVSSAEAFRSITHGGRKIKRLWNGLDANLLCVSMVACKFTIFQIIAQEVLAGGGGPWEAGAAGAVSCLLAGSLTYPLITLRTVVMASNFKATDDGRQHFAGPPNAMAAAALQLVQTGHLYAGIVPFLFRSVPPAALLFTVKRFLELQS
jgi:hypothetical protein